MEAEEQKQSSVRTFALGFGAGAFLLGCAALGAWRRYSAENELIREESETFYSENQELQRKLETAETLNSRLEKHNNRLMDEVAQSDIRLKRIYDQLQSAKSSSLTNVVKENVPEKKESPALFVHELVVEEKKGITLPFGMTRDSSASEKLFGKAKEPDLDSMIKEMSELAYSNYEKIKRKETPLYESSIKPSFVRIAKQKGLNISKFEELASFFEKQGKLLIISNVATRFGIVGNVHLVDIVYKERKNMTVDGKSLAFDSYGIQNSHIRDFTEYDSDGKRYITCFMSGNIVVHNMYIVNSRSNFTWDIIKNRRRSDIEFINNMTRAEFTGLYNECIRRNSSEQKAKEEFVKRVSELYMADADVNEFYHLSVKGTKANTKDLDENVRSVYFNYIHSPLSQASFNSEVHGLFGAKEGSRDNETAKVVFSEFVEYIKKQKVYRKFSNISINGNTLKEQIQDFYFLTGEEIKSIAKDLYDKRIARFR